MASNWYVRSGASGTGTGASWANATTTLSAALTLSAAGDSIYVSEDHAETSAATVTLTAPGTASAATRVICASHTGTVPPVSADLRTTATVTVTGSATGITITGYLYCYGITFKAGTTNTSIIQLNNADSQHYFEACQFSITSGGSSSKIEIGNSTSQQGYNCVWNNTTVKFASAGHAIAVNQGVLIWKNASSAVQGTVPTALFASTNVNRTGVIIMDGLDLSAVISGNTLIGAILSTQLFQIVNCKLASGVTVSSTPSSMATSQVDLIISDSGATGYRQERYRYQGTLTTETTDVRSAGASDSVTPISWKVATTANSSHLFPFECFQIAKWNSLTGSSRTASVEILNDGTTLTNTDVWMEVEYLGSSATPISSMATSGVADQLASGSSITTSSATWTTTGLTTPVTQTLSCSFTPQLAGYVRVVVKIAKTSKTIWVDPLVTIA